MGPLEKKQFLKDALIQFEKDLIERNFVLENVPVSFFRSKVRSNDHYIMEDNLFYYAREVNEIQFRKIMKLGNLQKYVSIYLRLDENENLFYELERWGDEKSVFFKTFHEFVDQLILDLYESKKQPEKIYYREQIII